MSERIEFPNEPIRVRDDVGPMTHGRYEPLVQDDVEDLREPEERNCQSCDGDGYVACEGSDLNCPEADDSGCYMSHVYRCTNCGGSGDAKDQTFW